MVIKMKIKSVSIYKIAEAGLLRVYYNMQDGFTEIGRVQITVRLNFLSDGDFTL